MKSLMNINSGYTQRITAVCNSVDGLETKRKYNAALLDFVEWGVEADLPFDRYGVQAYRQHMIDKGIGGINIRLSAIKKLAEELELNSHMPFATYAGIKAVKGIRQSGTRTGNWLTKPEANELLRKPDISTLKGIRDRAILALFLGSGLRREECAHLTFEHISSREERWAIVDIVGKRQKIRTIPIASWVYVAIQEWKEASGLEDGIMFRSINKADRISGTSMTAKGLRDISVKYCGFPPHDLRRTFAKLALAGGAELGQISLSLGHASLETTQKYLGIELDFTNSPSDKVGLRL